MSLEHWKSLFDIGALAFAGLVVVFGVAALLTGDIINKRQSEQLRQFDKDLTTAKLSLATQQERAAKADAHANEADLKIAEAQRGSAEANAHAKRAQGSLALAEQHSAEANAKAEGFRLDIAKANESARQAEARAAEANLELARFKAPRSITPAQQAALAAQLRSFAPRRIDVLIIGDTVEIQQIAESVLGSVQQAGWTIGNIGRPLGAGMAVNGIVVGTHLGASAEEERAANALINGLQAVGLASGRLTPQFNDDLPAAMTGRWDMQNTAHIRIVFGTKP
jgi:hypothetical protein